MTEKEIYKAFRYKLQGSKRMKQIVCQTLLLFPDNIIDHITQHCWFVSSLDDSWAFALRGDELSKTEHLIFLSDELLHESISQIRYTIAHEIGHVVLGHKNGILERQSRAEIRKQEKQADNFAKKFVGQ